MPAKRTARATPADRVTEAARKAGVRLVRFLYTDNGGVTRGKATHIEGLHNRIQVGWPIRFVVSRNNSDHSRTAFWLHHYVRTLVCLRRAQQRRHGEQGQQ